MRKIRTIAFLIALIPLLIACAPESTTEQNQSPPEFVVIDAPLTLNWTEPGYDIPRGSVVYHWANGITEVYGPNSKRIFIAKDSEAAKIATPTPPGSQSDPPPATRIYQVPNGTSIRDGGVVGTDNVTKMYLDSRLILTVIDKSEDYEY